VNRLTQSTLVGVVGFIAGAATLNGLFLNFVKPSLQWPLLLASAILVAMSIYGLFADSGDDEHAEEHLDQQEPHVQHVDAEPAGPDLTGDRRAGALVRGETSSDADGGSHSHAGGPSIGWLLLVPFLLLGVVVPPPLGAFSAQRDSGLVRTVDSAEGLPELAPSTGPLTMSLSEYSARALYDERRPLEGRTVRLTGFVSSLHGREGWTLTRMALSCCAADGYAVKVDVQGGQRLDDNTWLEVVGTWVPTPPSSDPQRPGLPIVRITSMTRVPQPSNPYE
jgi:uncharacterized repeat protein (TIGR03943 family)